MSDDNFRHTYDDLCAKIGEVAGRNDDTRLATKVDPDIVAGMQGALLLLLDQSTDRVDTDRSLAVNLLKPFTRNWQHLKAKVIVKPNGFASSRYEVDPIGINDELLKLRKNGKDELVTCSEVTFELAKDREQATISFVDNDQDLPSIELNGYHQTHAVTIIKGTKFELKLPEQRSSKTQSHVLKEAPTNSGTIEVSSGPGGGNPHK